MRKITTICVAALLATGISHAATPCNGFEIKLNNKTADDLLINKIELQGADINPGTFEKLSAHSKQAFTINNSSENKAMKGKFELHSISIPSKKVIIRFDLKNKKIYCEHNDNGSSGDYTIDKTRLPGNVTYSIK